MKQSAGAFSSWRVASVSLLSISSGLPLGLVIFAIPVWMTTVGVDIKTVGVITLAQVPYAFKFLWSPLMDRFWPPFLGRKRGWVLVMQAVLVLCLSALAWVATAPSVGVVAGLMVLISFASASQDIAYDAYAVEVLEPSEYGAATSGRTALYRAAMWVSGNVAISLGPVWGWRTTILALAGIVVALMPVTVLAAEVRAPPAPVTSLRDALWQPFVGFLSRTRALELAAFVFVYKLADNLAGALVRPFLLKHGYSEWDVGVGSGLALMISVSAGTVVGGVVTQRIGVTRALWIFGVIQGLGNLGYAWIAGAPVDRALLYSGVAIENFTSGLGNAAFAILLLKLTQKRFSATQFALLTSLAALGRTISGPPAGALAFSLGWRDFFLLSIPAAIPGLVLLHRFAPWSKPDLTVLEADAAKLEPPGPAWSTRQLWSAGLLWASGALVTGVLGAGLLNALRAVKDNAPFDLGAAVLKVLQPGSVTDAVDLVGAALFGLLCGLAVAAYRAARGQPDVIVD